MFKKFTKKPLEAEAFQFTAEMRSELIALGKTQDENPTNVKIPNIPDAHTYWNWYTQQLYIETKDGEAEINVHDWIVKETCEGYTSYYPMNNDLFLNTYDEI